jgi:hypothetical protein
VTVGGSSNFHEIESDYTRSVVVKVELGIHADDVAVGAECHRVDFDHCGVTLDEEFIQLHHLCTGLCLTDSFKLAR